MLLIGMLLNGYTVWCKYRYCASLVIFCLVTDSLVSLVSLSSKGCNTHLLGVDVYTEVEHRTIDVFFCK